MTSPSLADVKVGAHVAVFGTDAANTVTATKVAIGGPGGPPVVRGPARRESIRRHPAGGLRHRRHGRHEHVHADHP